MPVVDCHLEKRALNGPPEECGDEGVIIADGRSCFIALADVLGHGREAAEEAALIKAHLTEHNEEAPPALLAGLHERLKGRRGAVVFCGRLDLETGAFRYAGVGNISAKIFGAGEPRRLLSKDGVAGYMMGAPREATVLLLPRDVLVLCSDGVRDHFSVFEHPGLTRGTAKDIVRNFLESFSKGDDDASCLVMRISR